MADTNRNTKKPEFTVIKFFMEDLLSVADLCQIFSISKSTVHKISSSRVLPTYKPFGKCIYFMKADVEELLKRTRIAPLKEMGDDALSKLIKFTN